MRIYESAGGAPLQAGLSFYDGGSANRCELVSGVVMAVYVYDDPSHPFAKTGPAAVYCDCLVYSSLTGSRVYPVSTCLFLPSVSGVQSGVIRKPRATAAMVGGGAIDPQNPAQMDGDHVIIGFLDGRDAQPVILGFLPHPQADAGNESAAIGHRQRLHLVDGDPHFTKHHGCYFGVSDSGDVVLDATQGNSGALVAGMESPALDGSAGNVRLRANAAGQVAMSLVDATGATTALAALSGANVFTLGSGIDAAALASQVNAALSSIQTWAAAVVTATKGASPPIVVTPLSPLPNVTSTKLLIPG